MRFPGRILLLLGGLTLLLIAVLGLGERRMPTGPDGGGVDRYHENDARLPAEFQVATFNIHGCKGPDGQQDAVRVAECLEGLQIVGLNEVHGSPWSDPQDQASQLADLCGLPDESHVFAPAETQWFGIERFGNGLITRSRLLGWQRIPLPRRYDRSCRNMLLARINGPDGELTVLITHVARSDERERKAQLEAVLKLFGSLEPPAILLGDLNTAPGDPQMDRFLTESGALDAIQEGGVDGNDRVDWILIRGLKCLASQRLDNGASDHPCFTARLN